MKYRPVGGFPAYRVGRDGSLWSRHGGVWTRLRCKPRYDGYVQATFYREGVKQRMYLHRVVLAAFRGPCPAGKQARHLNGKRSDCRLRNLRWGTPKENAADRAKHGTVLHGQDHPQARLSNAKVKRILSALAKGADQRELADRYAVSVQTISAIFRGRRWRRLQEATARGRA